MTMDAWLFIFLGIIQTWTAVQGGIVSARTLPSGRERNVHIIMFMMLGVVGIGLITWQAINVTRAEKDAKNQQQQAIKETADKVTKDVTAYVASQYQDTVKRQSDKISELQSKLKEMDDQLGVIRQSNIVTGKNPVKVEVTNGPSTQQQRFYMLTSSQEDVLRNAIRKAQGSFIYFCSVGGAEEAAFADRLLNIFAEEGWNVGRLTTVGDLSSMVNGIRVYPHGLHLTVPEETTASDIVYKVFQGIGLPLKKNEIDFHFGKAQKLQLCVFPPN